MSEHQKCPECADRRRNPWAKVEDLRCAACADTGIVPDLDAVHTIKELALPGKHGRIFREMFLEKFPEGKATTRELLLWMADEVGPDWFFSQCIGISHVHAKFYNTVEQATRDAMRRVANSTELAAPPPR